MTVPTLNVAGWWDQEDFYGPIKIYELLERHDSAKQNFLVIGPWNHGGWSRSEGSKLGPVDFGSPTAAHYRKNILAPFFAHYLKDKGTARRAEAVTFRTGRNQWVEHTSGRRNRTSPRSSFTFIQTASCRSIRRRRTRNPRSTVLSIRRVRFPIGVRSK